MVKLLEQDVVADEALGGETGRGSCRNSQKKEKAKKRKKHEEEEEKKKEGGHGYTRYLGRLQAMGGQQIAENCRNML